MPFKLKFDFGKSAASPADTYNRNIYRGLHFGEQDDENEALNKYEQVLSRPSPSGNNEPQFEGTKAYLKHLQETPDRADYKASGWRRAGAILAGAFSGRNAFDVASGIVDQPYNNALFDWKVKAEGLEGAAKSEALTAQQNYRMGTLYRNMRADDIRDQNTDERLNFDIQKAAAEQEEKIKTREANGWKVESIGGRKVAYNPVTKEREDLGQDMQIAIAQQNARTNERNANTNAFNAQTQRTGMEGNLEVARTNAHTGQVNSDTNRFNANTNRMNTESLIDDRAIDDPWQPALMASQIYRNTQAGNRSAAGPNSKPRYIPIGEQDKAEVAAAAELIKTNPKWAAYVDDKGYPQRSSMLGLNTTNERDYQRFMNELKKKKMELLNTTFGSDFTLDDPDEDEDSIDDLPPG